MHLQEAEILLNCRFTILHSYHPLLLLNLIHKKHHLKNYFLMALVNHLENIFGSSLNAYS